VGRVFVLLHLGDVLLLVKVVCGRAFSTRSEVKNDARTSSDAPNTLAAEICSNDKFRLETNAKVVERHDASFRRNGNQPRVLAQK